MIKTAMRAYIGIDPGLKGGIGIIVPEQPGTQRQVSAWRMPVNDDGIDGARLAALLLGLVDTYRLSMVTVERVGAMPGQGVVSMFTFGVGFGLIKGVLQATGIKYALVVPVVWKRRLDLLGKDKTASVALVQQIYPEVSLTPAGCRVPSDGLADAVSIAHWRFLQEEHPLPPKPKPVRRRVARSVSPETQGTEHAEPHG